MAQCVGDLTHVHLIINLFLFHFFYEDAECRPLYIEEFERGPCLSDQSTQLAFQVQLIERHLHFHSADFLEGLD